MTTDPTGAVTLETTEEERAKAEKAWPLLSGYDDDGPIVPEGFWLRLLHDFAALSAENARFRSLAIPAGAARDVQEEMNDALQAGGEQAVTVGYTNWRGEYAERTIRPLRLWFGSTEWHPEPQWFVKALDQAKDVERDLALKDFGPPRLPAGAAEVEGLVEELSRGSQRHGIYLDVIATLSRQAAEIERLTGERDEARGELKIIRDYIRPRIAPDQNPDQIDHALGIIGYMVIETRKRIAAEASASRLRAQVEEARKVIEPFAKRADYFDGKLKANGGKWADDDIYVDDPPSDLFLGQLRTARAFLKEVG